MANRLAAYVTETVMISLLLCAGCEKNETTPEKKTETASESRADTSGGDSSGDELGEFLSKDKPADSGGLPPGHPPISGGQTGMSQSTPSMPPSHPPVGEDSAEAATALRYEPPIEWKPERVTSSMRDAQFLIPRAEGDTQDGQFVLFHFGAGQGGPIDMNIARWKNMFTTPDGQPVGDESAKVEKTEISGMRVTKLDVSGNYSDPMMVRSGGEPIEGEARMLAAIVEAPSGSWFFKAVGPKKTITAHEQSFHKMIESVK